MQSSLVLLGLLANANAIAIRPRQASSSVGDFTPLPIGSLITPSVTTYTTTVTQAGTPDYLQTTPELYPLATATAGEPFLRQSNPAPFASVSYIPPSPLETQEPIADNPTDGNIFHQMGNLSPYFASPGFGVDEYPIPDGAEIVWLNMLSRHGSRYPTDPIVLGAAINNATAAGTANFTGELSFLNTWKYNLGVNILSPWGRQELYDSGVTHNYAYGQLYKGPENNGTKLVVRSTQQDRMVKSAENFLAGFFGLGWTSNATLELIIDESPFNNSLAGYNACENNNNNETSAGDKAQDEWIAIYTANATARFNALSTGFEWNATWTYDAQQLCAYETVNLGYSAFCDLFTYQEWLDFEQSLDLDFAGTYGFQSPTGRAVGIGYVEEVLARINHHLITVPTGSVNVTLDEMPETFPLYQNLNFDFTHDVNIAGVLTAFGLTQFGAYFSPTTYDANRTMIVSHMEPFGARLDIELINSPAPICANRSDSLTSQYEEGGNTTYIHFILNQRTVPLGASFSACGNRADGYCELGAFLGVMANASAEADYDYACYGKYPIPTFGEITNGAPLNTSSTVLSA